MNENFENEELNIEDTELAGAEADVADVPEDASPEDIKEIKEARKKKLFAKHAAKKAAKKAKKAEAEAAKALEEGEETDSEDTELTELLDIVDGQNEDDGTESVDSDIDVVSDEESEEVEDDSEEGEGDGEKKKKKNKKNKKKAKKKINLGITIKLVTMTVIPMLVVALVIIALSVRTLTNAIETQIEGALKIVATSVNETYSNLYEGDYKQGKGGKVTKGEKTISGKNELIDALNEQTGYDVTFVFGNQRLITTFRKDSGKRINGTKLEEEDYAIIQTGEALFKTDAEVADRPYYIYYQPLVNSDGSIVGCIEVGTPSESVKKITTSQTILILIVSIIFMVLAAIFSFSVSRRMGGAMLKIKKFINLVKDGQLDAEADKGMVKRNDEIGDIYRTSVELQQTLGGIVNNIRQAADDLTTSAEGLADMAQNTQGTVGEVVHATEQIAERASSQAVDAKVTSDGVTEMNEEIKNIKNDMNILVTYAESMAGAEQKNRDIVEELNAQADLTREELDSVTKQIERMNNSVQSIEKAITLISDIADETDLLSLNASIEAARAGEAGRGFAVVAEQIKKLADQSNSSAAEIGVIIQEVMDVSKETEKIMQNVYNAMDLQQKKLDQTKEQSQHVSDSVDQSLEGISDISGKVENLRESSHDIKESVITLAEISEKTARSAESTIDTVDSMSDTMSTLLESADQLTVLADKLNDSLGVFHMNE